HGSPPRRSEAMLAGTVLGAMGDVPVPPPRSSRWRLVAGALATRPLAHRPPALPCPHRGGATAGTAPDGRVNYALASRRKGAPVVKFGIFYELSVPRPWTRESERTVYMNALEQVRLADE